MVVQISSTMIMIVTNLLHIMLWPRIKETHWSSYVGIIALPVHEIVIFLPGFLQEDT